MKEEYIKELEQLTPRQRKIVLDGLNNKLTFYKKQGILSYQYDICPICKDIADSPGKDPDCSQCYIPKSCKAPFNHGFLLFSSTIKNMEELVQTIKFEEPN